ncbi:MAG TPA: MltA domain-containing protein [Candidatus Binatia bacterium]|jgi:membrane-bound lytic murein transglycosylase A
MPESLHQTYARGKGTLCAALTLLAVFLGCVVAAEPPKLRDDLPRDSLLAALKQSRAYLDKLPENRVVGTRPRKITAGEMKSSLQRLAETLDLWDRPEKFAEAIRARFELIAPAAGAEKKELLVTGYYLPLVDARLTESDAYRYPLYRKPDGALASFSRREIDILKRLKGKGYEIAWVKDPIDVFFIHAQGSALLRLEDGRIVQLNYAANNGRPYTSIGKILIDEKKIAPDEMSAQRLRRYLAEHPAGRDALLARNERYVFFRFIEGGPLGSLEAQLTPGRSVAADPDYFPRAAPLFLEGRLPVIDANGGLAGWRPFSRFVFAQDSGAAIRGPGRLDLYFGAGDEAGHGAGFMKSGGSVYLLVEKKSAR